MLEIKNLSVRYNQQPILTDVSLTVPSGKQVVLMGPNGSGKSTLAQVIMGNPLYEVTQGTIFYQGKNLLELAPHERSKLGIFLSFQQPPVLQGVTVRSFLRAMLEAHHGKLTRAQFEEQMKQAFEQLQLPLAFADRSVNEGFSGGEKKRLEMIQLVLLQPKLAILDETDSGLDIDALRLVAQAVEAMKNPERSFLIITHYHKLTELLPPDHVTVMMQGKIVYDGSTEIMPAIEEQGYKVFLENH